MGKLGTTHIRRILTGNIKMDHIMLICEQNLTEIRQVPKAVSSRSTPVNRTSPLCGGYMSSNEVWTGTATSAGSSQRMAASAISQPFWQVYYFFIGIQPLGRFGQRPELSQSTGIDLVHPGQVLRGSLPLFSPAFRRSHFRHQVPQRRERS